MNYYIIIPAYNAEKTIKKCVQSIMKQTCPEWEAIVIDDGSNDRTYLLTKELAEHENRIRVFTQKNMGPGIARNIGIGKATGDFIIFLDADDYLEPDYIDCIDEIIQKEKADIVVIDNFYENERGIVYRTERLSNFAFLSKRELIAAQMTGKLPWGAWRKVVKHQILKENEIWFSSDQVGEEAVYSFNVFYYAQKIAFAKKCIYHYVNYSQSQSKKGDDDPWGPAVKKMRWFLEEKGILNTYENEWNSFAASALVVSLFRISCNHPFMNAWSLCRERIRDFKKKSSGPVNAKSLEGRVKGVLLLVHLNCVIPIICLSKIKKVKNGMAEKGNT